ncbi:MAG TPA: class I SAM-dependent methyltransferase [Anaerolineae bacterium]|nr:class I SAM-dependent methyltransferase [Anaerolineae bacterium]
MDSIPQTEIYRALERAFKIPGMYERDEGRFLYVHARRKGQLVEIGCWKGRTTAILLQAARVFGAQLTTVDPFLPVQSRSQATPENWSENLKQQGLTPPLLLHMPSAEAARTWENPLALAFIDGDHDYPAVQQDLALWTPFVTVGGVVLLHDIFFPRFDGVTRAVFEWFMAEHDAAGAKWKCLGLVHLTIAFKRLR